MRLEIRRAAASADARRSRSACRIRCARDAPIRMRRVQEAEHAADQADRQEQRRRTRAASPRVTPRVQIVDGVAAAPAGRPARRAVVTNDAEQAEDEGAPIAVDIAEQPRNGARIEYSVPPRAFGDSNADAADSGAARGVWLIESGPCISSRRRSTSSFRLVCSRDRVSLLQRVHRGEGAWRSTTRA